MCAYRDKFRQPLTNIRRWITDLGHSPIVSGLGGNRSDGFVPPGSPAKCPIASPGGENSTSSFMDSPSPSRMQEQQGDLELGNIKQSLDSIKICSANISKTQMKEFREAFGFFDKDGDGFITSEELGIVMRSLGQFASEDELKEMLKEVDINGDGLFSLDEFVEIVSNYSGNTGEKPDEEQELRDAFRIFDKHSRGFISASDLRAVLHCLGEDLSEDEIEDMIKEVDVDGDGRIDFNEFVRALGEPDPDESEPEDNDVRGSTETAGDQLQI